MTYSTDRTGRVRKTSAELTQVVTYQDVLCTSRCSPIPVLTVHDVEQLGAMYCHEVKPPPQHGVAVISLTVKLELSN